MSTSEVRRCADEGWTVGTILRGHEEWSDGRGVWNTIRITAVGEESLLARCLRHECTDHGAITETVDCECSEGLWTLRYRDWQPTRHPRRTRHDQRARSRR